MATWCPGIPPPSQVSESYVYLVLMRVLKQQEVLNKANTSAMEQKDSIQEYYIQVTCCVNCLYREPGDGEFHGERNFVPWGTTLSMLMKATCTGR